MNASNGAVVFKIDTSNLDLAKIVKDLLGSGFEETDNLRDITKNDCIYISKTKEFLVIMSSDFSNIFFETQDITKIHFYLDYFSNPNFVFAFEEYDDTNSYGYSLIYDGVVKRQFRSVLYQITVDYGQLEEIELNWQNAERVEVDLGDGKTGILYQNFSEGYLKEELPQIILQELMFDKLGFYSWNMGEFITEQGHFRKSPKKTK